MYEIFLKLLKAKGCSAYQVSKATGIAQSTIFLNYATRNATRKKRVP